MIENNKIKLSNNTINQGSYNILIMTPSRELAIQTMDEICKLADKEVIKNLGIESGNIDHLVTLILGGCDINKKIEILEKKNPRIIICNPSPFLKIISREKEISSQVENQNHEDKKNPLNLSDIGMKILKYLNTIIIDEADKVIQPLSKYASLKEKLNRKKHPLDSLEVIKKIYW